MPTHRRTLRWERAAETAQEALAANVPRLDEIIAGIEDRISNDAEGCESVPGTPSWRGAASVVTVTTPIQVVAFFTIENDDLCAIVSLWAPGIS